MVNDISHGLIEGNQGFGITWVLEKTINHVEEVLPIHLEAVQKAWRQESEHGQS